MPTYKSFKTSSQKETTGIYFDLGDDGKFLLARSGGANDKFEKAFMTAMKPHKSAVKTETLSSTMANKILAGVYADSVILGWEGVTGEDGQSLPYSRDNCVKLLTDLPDLFAELRKHSSDMGNFKDEMNLDAAKN